MIKSSSLIQHVVKSELPTGQLLVMTMRASLLLPLSLSRMLLKLLLMPSQSRPTPLPLPLPLQVPAVLLLLRLVLLLTASTLASCPLLLLLVHLLLLFRFLIITITSYPLHINLILCNILKINMAVVKRWSWNRNIHLCKMRKHLSPSSSFVLEKIRFLMENPHEQQQIALLSRIIANVVSWCVCSNRPCMLLMIMIS